MWYHFSNMNINPELQPQAPAAAPQLAEAMKLSTNSDVLLQKNAVVKGISDTIASVPPEVKNALISTAGVAGAVMFTWWSIKTLVTGENQFFKGL